MDTTKFPYKKLIEDRLKEYVDRIKSRTIPELYKSIKYCLISESKRIRPIFFLSLINTIKKEFSSDEIDLALSFEIIHTASLIHDDLPSMDNQNIRRNKTALHVVFNEATAILVGDIMWSLALELVILTSFSQSIKLRIFSEILNMVGLDGMIAGQLKDITLKNNFNVSKEEALFVISRKTAKIFETVFRVAGIISERDEETIYNLGKYGFFVGNTFQIIDDIMDSKNDKGLNFSRVVGIDSAKNIAKDFISKAIDTSKTFTFDFSEVNEITKSMLNIEI